MSSKKSLRVYFVTHRDGRVTGILLRTWDWFFDRRPPSAYGTSEDDVYDQLHAELHAMAATRDDSLDRYLWDESFDQRSITVDVHPQTSVKKRTVKLLDHEYQTLLPDIDELPQEAFEFKYVGPDNVFTKTQEQLEKQGYIRIGDTVPDFIADTSMGSISLHEFIGDSWCVLFSHPADFTPVCTTEFGATARLKPEWSRRGVKVIGLSVDSTEDHARWIADINETQQTQVDFPIIADKDRRISMLFGMLDATTFHHGTVNLGATMTVRSVFIISPAKRVELIISYPAHIGRSFDEILRVLDALQLSAKHRVATPANWRPGDDTVVLPFISDAEAEELFADQGGFRKVRSYLRFVRDPSLRCL